MKALVTDRTDWRLGDYRKAFKAEIKTGQPVADLGLFDPPYGPRTHEGFRTGKDVADDSGISYRYWTRGDVRAFVHAVSPLVRGWFIALTSHDLIPAWEEAFEDVGRLGFAPLPVIDERPPHAAPCAVVPSVITGGGVRFQGDGPSNWTIQLVAARPRNMEFAKWCKNVTTPSPYYIVPRASGQGNGQGKPDKLLRSIVHDYSQVGDTVLDLVGGRATTGVAALGTGRFFKGSEIDRGTWEIGRAALLDAEQIESAAMFRHHAVKQRWLFEEEDHG